MARLTRFALCGAAFAMGACLAPSSWALDPRYPDWPCQQLKVPGIAIAGVWNGPSIENIDPPDSDDPRQAELVPKLVARRTPMEEARQMIRDDLIGSAEEKRQKATTLFAALYAALNGERNQVMNGIERFSRKQKAMAEQIRDTTKKIRDVQDRPDANPADSEALANQLSWQTRIFEDWRQTTSYICDVPVLIEKRLFNLATAIQDVLNAAAPEK